MPEQHLHVLGLESDSAIALSVDADRREKMSEAMEARIFRRAVFVDDSSGDLRRVKAALDDVGQALDVALGAREHEFAGCCESMLFQDQRQVAPQWHGAGACF